jgi:phosphoribosylamine--glycine ligase
MGAFSPLPATPDVVVDQVMDEAIRPTLAALRDRGIDYRGVLYAGLMLTPDGPKVLEFNVRFGDPETQVVVPRWQGDVAAVMAAAAAGRLDTVDAPEFSPDAAVCVVLAAPGYPVAPRTGQRIDGIEEVRQLDGIQLFAAGVKASQDGQGLVTAGGRVLGVGATGSTIAAARQRVYDALPLLSWPGMAYRRDIAGAAAEVRA